MSKKDNSGNKSSANMLPSSGNKKPSKPWYKRFWVWILIFIVAFILFGHLMDSDDSKTSSSSPKTHLTEKQKEGRKEMLRVLNMWANHNHNYGKVKINNENNVVLVLNDDTANNSSDDELSSIATQFNNKVNAQKDMYHAKVHHAEMVDKDGNPKASYHDGILDTGH